MFEETLDLAARIERAVRVGDFPYAPMANPWWLQWHRLPWPVPMLLPDPNPPKPLWPDGARWEWRENAAAVADGRYMWMPNGQTGGPGIAEQPVLAVSARRFLVDHRWERYSPEALAVEAVSRVYLIAALELDARLDDDLAVFPSVTATRARRAQTSAEAKRHVAGDLQMTLDRIPDDWMSVVFESEKSGRPARGKW